MVLFIILLILFLFGVWLFFKQDVDKSFDGFMLMFLIGIPLSIHSMIFFTASYKYNLLVVERDTFQQTLDKAREGKKNIETAAITKDVIKWNNNLAKEKYNNNVFFIGQYIDDRIEDLEPIE